MLLAFPFGSAILQQVLGCGVESITQIRRSSFS